MLARAAFMRDPVGRIAGVRRHIGMVKRLPKHKQAILHQRTIHALHQGLRNDPSGRKGLGLILAKRRLQTRTK